ncbi:glycerate kinase family protein [Lapidilactobacillus wuchangensis]|uniref:glycerate kinase family protein n=1 Tax=Lapidilactobacillus wuchangensis TaxID=2486001 RepID=UPI000F776EAD|nr:glycerate kinase [Lapidilactobacillus wuchangensis]
MKVVAAIDSFKGSATSAELNQAFFQQISSPELSLISVPIADGGEGTMAAIKAARGGHYQKVTTIDLLGRPLTTEYLVTKIAGVTTAVIESAKIIGLDLIVPSATTIQQASSYGLGLVLRQVITSGCQQIYLSLGGSGTSDGGLGLLAGLGAKINGQSLNKDNLLNDFRELDLTPIQSLLRQVKLTALVDVDNPYAGPKGFAPVFGPQKGGTATILQSQNQQAAQVLTVIKQQYQLDLNQLPGAGAAGGLGGALALIGAKLAPGFATISQLVQLPTICQDADLIITGEGRIDGQTDGGKVPLGVAELGQQLKIPVVAICGSRAEKIGRLEKLVLGVYCIQSGPVSLATAVDHQQTLMNVSQLGVSLLQTFYRKSLRTS